MKSSAFKWVAEAVRSKRCTLTVAPMYLVLLWFGHSASLSAAETDYKNDDSSVDLTHGKQAVRDLIGISPHIYCHSNSELDGLTIEINEPQQSYLQRILQTLQRCPFPIEIRVVGRVRLRSDEWNEIAAIKTLRDLDLSQAITDGEGLSILLRSSRLRSLILPSSLGEDQTDHLTSWPEGLQYLDLNGFDPSPVGWDAIRQLRSLKCIYASRLDVPITLSNSAWDALTSLPEIEHIRINVNNGIVPKLAQIRSLKTIGLVGDERVTAMLSANDIAALSRLPQCRTLYLGGIQIGGDFIVELAKLEALEDLRLRRCDLSHDAQTRFQLLKQVRSLDISSSLNLQEPAFHSIAQMEKLQNLDIGGCAVEDSAIVVLNKLPSLLEIRMGQTNVTDAGIKLLLNSHRLRCIDVQNTSISDKAIDEIVAHPTMQNLSIANSRVTRHGIKRLSELSSLRILDISGISIDSDCAASLTAAKSLVRLYAANCSLDDECLKSLVEIPTLQQLDASHNPQITTKGIYEFLAKSHIVALSVDGCGFTPEITQKLGVWFYEIIPRHYVAQSVADAFATTR